MVEAVAAATGVPAAPILALLAETIADGGPCGSLLTPGGFPAEFTLGVSDRRVRLTLEPCAAGAPPDQKRRRMRALIGRASRVEPWLEALVAESGARFGGWLGARIDRTGAIAFKQYHEVVPAAAQRVRARVRAEIDDDAVVAMLQPLIIGVQSPESAWEVYARLERPTNVLLHRLLSYAATPIVYPVLLRYLAVATGVAHCDVTRVVRLGASLRFAASGAAPQLTLFAHSRNAWPTNRIARARLMELAADLGSAPAGYAEACEAIDIDNVPFNLHGMVGLTPLCDGRLALSIGLRPPDAPGMAS